MSPARGRDRGFRPIRRRCERNNGQSVTKGRVSGALVVAVSPLLVTLWPVKYERRRFCSRMKRRAGIKRADILADGPMTRFTRENQAMHARNCSYGKGEAVTR